MRIEKYTQGSSAATKHETSERKTDDTKLWKFCGGGRSKRLGVATLSGLLAVGLTPAFVTPAFANGGGVKGDVTTASASKITVPLTISGTDADTAWTDTLFKAHFEAGTSNAGNNCPNAPADKEIKKQGAEYKAESDGIDLTNLANSKDCEYKVTLAEGTAYDNKWSKGSAAVTVKFSRDGSGTLSAASTPDGQSFTSTYTKPVAPAAAQLVQDVSGTVTVNGSYENTVKGNPAAKFTDAYQVEVKSLDGNSPDCSGLKKDPSDTAYSAGQAVYPYAAGGTNQDGTLKLADVFKFTKAVDGCKYEIRQVEKTPAENAPELDRTGWTPDKHVYTLTLQATNNGSVSVTKVGKLQVSEDGVKPATDATPEELRFANKYESDWKIRFLKAGTVAANSSADAYAKVKAVDTLQVKDQEKIDKAKLPTTVGKYCEDQAKPVLLGWKKVTTPTTGSSASLAGAFEDGFAGNVTADADYEAVCGAAATAAVSATNVVTIDNVVKNTADNGVKNLLKGTNFTAQLVLQTTSDTTGEALPDAAKCPDPQQLANKAEFTKKIENAGVITFPDMVFSQPATCVYKVVENGEAPNWDKITPETPQITIAVSRANSGDKLEAAAQNPVAASARLQSVAPVKVTFQATDTTFGKAPATTTQVLIYGKAGARGVDQAAKQAESQLNIPAGKKLAGWSETGSLPLVDLTKEIFKANSQGLYRPVWGTDATVKFYKEGVKEPVTTQTLVTGQPVKNTGDNGVKLDDASKFCANPTDEVTGWHQTGTKPGVYQKTADITAGNAEYTAHCVTPQVTFKGGSDSDATKNGSFKQGEDSVSEIKVNVAGLAAPTVAKPTADSEKNKSFAGWKLTRNGDPLDGAAFNADLSNTIPASTPAVKYEPRNGDVLTAQWAYTATFQKKIDDTKGETIGYEFVGSSAPDGTELTNGKSVKTERLCPTDQVATGKWSAVTLEDGKEKLAPAAAINAAPAKDTVYRADCSKATNKIEFHVNGMELDGKAVTGARFLDSVVEDVNHESLNADKTVLTVTKDVFTGYQAPTNEQVVYKGHQLVTSNSWMKGTNGFAAASAANGDEYVAQWKKADTPKVRVTFSDSTGPGVVLAQQWVEYNAGFTPVDTSKACVDKTKPVFDHWENADSKKVDETTPLQGNATLKAVCKEGSVAPAVTFDANGGKFADGVNPVVEIKDGKVEFAAEPKLDGKAFAGWCTEKPADGTCAPEKVFKNEGLKDSTTVYAYYVPSFKVTFDLKGGKLAEGEKAEALTDAKGMVQAPKFDAPQGKVFTKWCEVPAEGELDEAKCADFDFTKAIDKDTTLKAVYKTAVTVKLQPGIKDAKAVDTPVAEGSKVKDLDTKGMCAEGFDFSKWDADGEATVEAGKTYTATCVAHVDMVKVTVKHQKGETTVEVAKDATLKLADLPLAKDACTDATNTLTWQKNGKDYDFNAKVTEAFELNAKCEAKTTPGGSTGGSTGGSSSGGSYFGGGSFGGGSSTPSTPAKDKKPGDKKPGDKKPGAKQPVVNKFDKQFTKKVELPKSAVKRAAGADRVATSVAALSLAKNHEVVVLATGSNFPDALVGGALAGAYKAGVVLTTGATLEQSVLDSLKSYKTKTVHIVGGNGAVSLAKEAQLRAAGLEVIRHAGADRYATAQAVKAATLKALGGKSAISCNATGSNFPDALACSSAASQMGGVVDLVKPGTAVAKDATAKTVCAGGPACQAAGAGVDKVVGSDRYETAYKLAEMTPAKGSVLVSNGQSYADSLVAGALAGSLQADLVLAKPTRVNVPADTKSAQLFGGTTVLPDSLSMYTK